MNIKTTWLSFPAPLITRKKVKLLFYGNVLEYFLRHMWPFYIRNYVSIIASAIERKKLRFASERKTCLRTLRVQDKVGEEFFFDLLNEKNIDALFCSGIRAKEYVEKRACKTIFFSTQVTYRILEPKPVVGIKHTLANASDTLKSSKKLKSFYSQSFFTSFCHSNSK